MIRLGLAISLLLATDTFAFSGRVLGPDGKPVANASVSVAGRSLQVTTATDGSFVIEPPPVPPFTLVIISSRGEISQQIEVTDISSPLEINLVPHVSEAITVATGVAPDILTTPANASTFISREDLEQRVPEHFVDAVVRTPGVDRRGEGPPAVPVIRGLAGGRTLIIVDDARITAERRAGPSATFLDPFSLASVEIARGAGSVAYGSDAFGGVIHARTPDPDPVTSVRYQVGSAFGATDADSAGIMISLPIGSYDSAFSLYGREADAAESAGGVPIPNAQYSSRGGSLRFVRPTKSGSIRAAITIDQARDVGAPAADTNVTLTYYPEEDSNRLTFGADHNRGTARFELRGALGSYEITTNRERLPGGTTRRQISTAEVAAKDASLRLIATTPLSQTLIQSGFDFTSRFDLRALGSVTVFAPGDLVLSETEEITIDDASRNDLGLFVIAETQMTPAIALSGGLRADLLRVSNEGGFFGSRSRSDQALSGHASLRWTNGPFDTSMQLASGFREPTLSDRYFRGVSGRGFVVGNPDLEPERSLQLDFATRWQRGRRSLALYAYEYRIHDLIERYSTGTDFAFRNRGEAEVRGVELEFTTPLSAQFALQGGIAAARGETADDGTPLDDITPLKTNLELRWSSGPFSVFASGLWFGEDDQPGPVETVRPAHTTVDLGAGWKFRENADFRITARNVFDVRYAASADANAALAQGQAVTLSLHGRI